MAANSTLQIEVVSKGIQDAVTKLDSLGNAAARNEVKVAKLTDSLGLLMTAQDNAVAKASQHAMLMNSIAQQMGLASDAAKEISKSVNNLTANLNTLSVSSDKTANSFSRKASAGGIVNSTIQAMTAAALAYLGINFAKGIVEASDGWAMMQAKLKLATGSMEEAKKVQADLFDVAQRIRVPLSDIGQLYTRMAVPMQRMGKDAKQTAEQVEFVSLALKLNGATGAEASSVMLQYSQSVNAGRLNGAEFNAVAEGAPGILRAIEAELKATGKFSEYSGKSLKQMGSDGEISFDLMNRAAQRALPKMREDFLALPLTVDGAMQRVKNAWFKAMGEMGEDTQMGTKLAQAIRVIEDNIPRVRDALAGAFIVIYENFSKIVVVIEALIAIKLVMWIGGAATAITALAGTLATMAVGVGVAEGAVLAFGRAIALMAGPVGIFIALIGVGLVQAYRAYQDTAPVVEKTVTDVTAKNTEARIKMVQAEIDKIDERNGKAKVTVSPLVQGGGGSNELSAQLERVQGFQKKLKESTTLFDQRMAEEQVKEATDRYTQLALIEGKGTLKVFEETARIRREKIKGLDSQFGLSTEKKSEQADREVKEAKARYAEEGVVLSAAMELRIRQKVLGENLGVKAPERDPYKELRASLKATRLELELNIATNEKATASEKLRASMDSGKNVDYRTLTGKKKSDVDADLETNRVLEQQIIVRDRASKATIDAAAESERYDSKIQSGIVSLNNEIDKTRLQTAALTQSKTAVKELAAAKLESEAQDLESQARKELEKNNNVKRYDLLMAEAAATRLLGEEKVKLGIAGDTKDAMDALNNLLDPKRAMNFGTALSDSFGEVGNSIGKMSKALGIFGKEQDDVEKTRTKLLGLPADAARQKGLAVLDEKETQSKLRMYGAMAGGVKNLFSQHTAAYKVLGIAEQGFRLAELAGTAANFAMKSGLLEAFTAMFIGSKATETAVDSAQTVFMLSEHAAAGVADVALTGTTEAAKNTLKIPGVLMSFMSWLGPWGIAAGGVAIAAVLGAALGGGGGGDPMIDAKDRQAKQGTGTVLGDDTAKSASIVNSLTGLESNSNIGLVLTSNMLSSLRGIEAAMTGLSTAIYKVPGMTTGRNFGITEGKQGGGFLSSVFGGDTVTSIVDTGLSLNGTAQQFKQGQGIQQYVDVNKQESGGWFSSDSSTNSRDIMMANDEITKTIGRVFDGINATISTAAISLGGNGDSIRAALDAFVVSTEVSFKGLKGDELQQALNSVFSASADSMAQLVFPSLAAFQKAGEGYYQTVIRVSTGTEQAQNALKGLGVAMISKDVLTNKTGDFAVEMVRQSIMAEMAGTTIAEVMRLMSGNLSELIDGYKSLLTIQDTMRAAKLGSGGVSMDTIRGAGGLSELKSSLISFVDNFYTDAEKQTISFSKLHEEFVRLNVVMPESKEAFKSLVSTLMAGDGASQELAGRVLLLGGSFSEAFSMAENAIKDAAAAAKELVKVNQGWLDQLDVLTGKQTDRSLALRDATDESTRALMRQVYAQQDIKTASEAAKVAAEAAITSTKAGTTDALAALQRAIAAEKTRITVIRDVAAESVKSITGVFELLKAQVSQLYGTVESTKAMQATEGNAFIDNALSNASATGYMPDLKQLTEAVAAARGGLSSTQFATQFEADQAALVMAGKLSQLEIISGDQLTAAEIAMKTANDQLKALDESLLFYQRQVDAINDVNTSVISVKDAIGALTAALLAQQLLKTNANAGAVAAAASYVSSMPEDKTYNASAAIPVSERDRAVQAIYSSVLGRVADAGGLADFSNSNLSLSQITANIQGSAEAAARAISVGYQNAFNGAVNSNLGLTSTIKAFAAGGDFEGGLRLVGENGPEIEATGPSRIFNAGQTRSMLSGNGSNNEQLEILVGELTFEVKRLQGLVAQGNVNTERTAKAVHGNPDRPVLVEIAT